VRVQIQSGPGPFGCSVLGTIAALPAGTIPEPPAPDPAEGDPATQPQTNPNPAGQGSAATGMRLVCAAPADVKLINGAGATLEVVTASVTNVMVLPVEAVAGSQGKGQVDVMQPDGTRKTVEVEARPHRRQGDRDQVRPDRGRGGRGAGARTCPRAPTTSPAAPASRW
jgi:hypothetical protein